MQTITINVLGFEPTKSVPSSVEEYNALAPKRANPVLEDAIDTIVYRGTSPVIREKLCDHLEKTYSVKRNGSDEDGWEKESVYVKRAIATVVKDSGRTEAQVRAEIAPFVQTFADEAPFPVATKERSSDGPAIGKRDLQNAGQIIKDGKQGAVASKLAGLLGRDVTLTGTDVEADTKVLARALADYRRQVAEQANAALVG